ncbi:MAG: hypothetical protein COX02_02185 [Candidatus Vogelbacteria bacterium CG22_combo_CG10-13_8_21_14_all_37_9]|uniref:Uncharacterized protein n=1 Tax=Candidatus Vogelbacteria bacterium CG22_combo_CG10-13_8_21_14_all_37_9 TaxID=1975046 RepID=A0A2H0BKL1_9BACT|nr:MAG: hypothetical protein COX02_02185 [Candidatus Vogelbacteria bacterium CG22_combo_CG10-13_8_21_14_all_37_9]
MKKYLIASSSVLALPIVALAQYVTALDANSDANIVAQFLNDIFSLAIIIIIGLAAVYFVWSIVGYIMKAGEEKEAAKSHMLWGIIIIVVMLTFWGIVGVVRNSVFGPGGGSTAPTDLPGVPGRDSGIFDTSD